MVKEITLYICETTNAYCRRGDEELDETYHKCYIHINII